MILEYTHPPILQRIEALKKIRVCVQTQPQLAPVTTATFSWSFMVRNYAWDRLELVSDFSRTHFKRGFEMGSRIMLILDR